MWYGVEIVMFGMSDGMCVCVLCVCVCICVFVVEFIEDLFLFLIIRRIMRDLDKWDGFIVIF